MFHFIPIQNNFFFFLINEYPVSNNIQFLYWNFFMMIITMIKLKTQQIVKKLKLDFCKDLYCFFFHIIIPVEMLGFDLASKLS